MYVSLLSTIHLFLLMIPEEDISSNPSYLKGFSFAHQSMAAQFNDWADNEHAPKNHLKPKAD